MGLLQDLSEIATRTRSCNTRADCPVTGAIASCQTRQYNTLEKVRFHAWELYVSNVLSFFTQLMSS